MKTYQKRIAMTLIGSLGFIQGCNSSQANTKTEQSGADKIFTQGVIYTADAQDRVAEAIAIKDGYILYVGNNQQALAYQDEETEVIPLNGKMMLPGIHDSHVHVLEAGSEVGGNCWLEPVEKFEDYQPQLKRCAQKARGTDWVLAYGHELEELLELVEHPAKLLDSMISDRPVAIMEQSSHSAWVNSKALELAGYSKGTSDPAGGIIVKDEEGYPTGVLLETASERVFNLALKTSHDAKTQQEAFDLNYDGLLWSLDQIAQNGITSFCDARVYWQRGWLDVWKQAEIDGKLTARANLGLWAYAEMDDAEQIKALKSMYQFNEDSLLKVNQIKLYSDGIIHNTTAALKDTYVKGSGPFPETHPNYGLNYFTQARLERYIKSLQDIGFDFHIHAIGDRGVHEALNAIENTQSKSKSNRHRLTHVEMIDDTDLPRFNKLNVTADMQVAGEFTLPHNHHWQESYIGERAYHSFRLNELQQSGANVVLSSDWTVSPLSPFIGIQNAINRGNQSLSLTQAIKAYTINAAWLMRQEALTGSLEKGKAADLIVIDQNLFKTKVSHIHKTNVLMTMLEGEIVWEAE